MLWNLKPATLIAKAKDYISTTVDFAAATTMSYNVPNAKIWGWDVMTKYTTDLFSLDVAYNRTCGKDTDTGEYISSINRIPLPVP